MKIFLDDLRFPAAVQPDADAWTIARNFDEFQQLIETHGTPTAVSFDNDLGKDGAGNMLPEGWQVLQWLIDTDHIVPFIFVHSDNTPAAEDMEIKARNWHKFLRMDGLLPEENWVKRVAAARIMWQKKRDE